jgi:hypothetical protein
MCRRGALDSAVGGRSERRRVTDRHGWRRRLATLGFGLGFGVEEASMVTGP